MDTKNMKKTIFRKPYIGKVSSQLPSVARKEMKNNEMSKLRKQ